MKKIFIAVMAMAAFAACSNENTIVTPQGAAIAFGDAFVDNSTKAIIASANNIQSFQVFGNVVATDSGNDPVALYGDTGAAVDRDGAALDAAWSCGVTRYWTPSCTFNFAAVANGTATVGANGLPTSISYTLNATDPADLIYATQVATTDNASNPITGVNTNKVVAFTFNHLLSKVTFTVDASAITKNEYSVVVTDIAITGAVDKGTYTVDGGTWAKADGATTVNQDYYDGAYVSHLLIPVAHALGVTVTYNILFDGKVIQTGLTKNGTVNYTFAKNTAYTITAALSALNEIQFSVATNGIGGWTDGSGATIQ